MKKETLIAVFFGIMLGVAVAVGMIAKTRQKQMEQSKPISSDNKNAPTISVNNPQFRNLEVTDPQDSVIVNKKSITIKGKASKDSLLIIQSPIKDVVVKNVSEDFSVDFPLAFGENVIHIVSYPKDVQIRSQEKELKVYYLDEQ